MITWQDYEKAEEKTKWVRNAIISYRNSKEYRKAVEEEEYMAGRNVAILETMRVIYNMAGIPENDFTKTNTKIRNRLIHRLVTGRCSYSLGNGISFAGKTKETREDGSTATVDATKETLGDDFDQMVYQTAYWAQGNGAAYKLHKTLLAFFSLARCCLMLAVEHKHERGEFVRFHRVCRYHKGTTKVIFKIKM